MSVFVLSLIFFVYQAQIMLSIQVQFTLFENMVPLKTEKSSDLQRCATKKKHLLWKITCSLRRFVNIHLFLSLSSSLVLACFSFAIFPLRPTANRRNI